jgi:hypothetical protein
MQARPGSEPLDHLRAAVALAGRLGEAADHLIGHFVDEARAAGASWTEIGANLGVTKQAAQKRFVPRESEDLDFPDRGPLTRFTPRARNVITSAKSEAAFLGHTHVTNETMLLGLISEPDGLAAQAIVAVGRPLVDIREAVLARQKKSRRRAVTSVHFSGESKKTLELSLRTALAMDHNYIGTEHLLLALLESEDDAGPLHRLGVDQARVEADLIAALSSLAGAKDPSPSA